MPDAVFLLRCGCETFDNGLIGRFLKKGVDVISVSKSEKCGAWRPFCRDLLFADSI